MWDQCSHGLTSRPLETCHHQCLKAVCGLLGCPAGAAAELLDGSLKLRYCTTQFSRRLLPWTLPRSGRVVPGGSLGKRSVDVISDPRDGGDIAIKVSGGRPVPGSWPI